MCLQFVQNMISHVDFFGAMVCIIDSFFGMLIDHSDTIRSTHKFTSRKNRKGSHSRSKQSKVLQVLALITTMHLEIPMCRMDTDARIIGKYNRCTACISSNEKIFVGPLCETSQKIKGFSGSITGGTSMGTLWWRWKDDTVQYHTFMIHDSYYVPGSK